MSSWQTFPFGGFALAMVTVIAMIMLNVDPIVTLAVLIVWLGSLLAASGRPPEAPPIVIEAPMSLESMRKLIEDSSTPLLVTEKNTIAFANASARRMLGKHIVGQDARVTFRQPEAIALINEDRDGQAIVRGLVRRQDIWQINRHRFDEDRTILELINQTAEADISRAHTDFVANASHELRTPLAAILGYVETLRENPESLDTPTSQKFLETIDREGHRLQSLISDLMSLSRVEAEKHDLPDTLLEFAPIVERAARDAAGPDRAERIEISVQCDPLVKGDQQQLEQVVRNLVDNALKYGASDAPVRVEIDQARDNMVRVCVSDKGEGIAPEQLPHLTRRFYRTDPGRSRASGGTGLGLAIVKHIVERHRGRLNIESDLGVGTRVTVRLPISVDLKQALEHADEADAEMSEDEANPERRSLGRDLDFEEESPILS